MEKIWLKSYPKNIPAEVDLEEFTSLNDVFERSARLYADQRAFSNMGAVLTYRELDERSRAFGAWLQHRAGLGKGDRIALMLPNVLQYPVALLGALRVGLTVVNVNPLYTVRELSHQLDDSGARAIVILENFAHTLEQVPSEQRPETVLTTRVGDLLPIPKAQIVNAVVKYIKKAVPQFDLPEAVSFRKALQEGARLELETTTVEPTDLAFLQYTGGTTGTAKGAMLTHRNMIANLQQASVWIAPKMRPGQEIIITALPLYHIFSLLANCLMFIKNGGENVLITNPRDLPGFVKELRRHPFTAFTGVNTLFNGLLNTPGFADVDFSHLRLTLGGGMAVQRRVAERWKATTGSTLVEAYGLTETSPAVCINPVNLAAYNGSVGLPIPSTEVSIRDDQGNELALGENGELCIRGPQVMAGYWGKGAAETKSAFLEGGWLRSGDIARMDAQGYVYLVDRKKDMINVSGFNVYPNEVEDVLVAHPDVLEAAVIGLPDEAHGERLKAFLVCGKRTPSTEEMLDHCRKQLTGYKIPREIEFRSELPKSNVGKVLRRNLREEEIERARQAA
ncbi:MAG: AMP-binding protein [Nitrococcus mobilis]|nr:AMP-binding protein [Nitrococcus mobilis]